MWFLTHTWIMPALMALSFLAILAVGKRLPKKGSEIGVAAVGICFVLALLTAGSWWQHTNDTGESGEHASGVLAVAPGAGDAEEHDPEAFSDVEQGCSRVVDEADHEGNSEKAEADHEGDTEGEEHSSGIAPGESASAESTAVATAEEGEGHAATKPVVRCFTWFDNGPADSSTITVGTMVDGQSVFMLVVVGLISLLVHIYSTDYVNGDRRYTHTAVDAAIQLREAGLVPAEVRSAHLGVASATVRTIGEPLAAKQRPETGYQAQFSGPFAVAAALTGGDGLGLGLGDFDDARVHDPDLMALMSRITVGPDESCDAVYPHQFPAVLTVTTTSGEELRAAVMANRGGARRPLSTEELCTKFSDNTAGLLAPAARDSLISTVAVLEELRHLAPLMDPLRDLVP